MKKWIVVGALALAVVLWLLNALGEALEEMEEV